MRELHAGAKELKLLKKLRREAELLVAAFHLPAFGGLAINETLVENGCYGWCRVQSGFIELRLRRADGNFYRMNRILDTLAHELAHLAHPGHDKAHKILGFSIFRALLRAFQSPKAARASLKARGVRGNIRSYRQPR